VVEIRKKKVFMVVENLKYFSELRFSIGAAIFFFICIVLRIIKKSFSAYRVIPQKYISAVKNTVYK